MTKSFDMRAMLLTILMMLSATVFAQVTVTGVVTESSGEPVIGATIREKGNQTNGTVTDIDGNYSIKVANANATLIFSYVGLETQEVKLNGRKKVNVTLNNDDEILEEVVVVGYGTQKKVTMTGAVANVGSRELLKSPVANLGNSLQGKLPGVQTMQPSGMPGDDSPAIRIRGVGSLNSAEPLVLVDGVERSFNQIDPNEVADISILKDASATAVFGVRGANGVILVTTKRGEVGKPTVSVTASAAVQQISKFVEFVDSYTHARLNNYATITDGLPMSQWPGTTYISDYTPYENLKLRFSQDVVEHFRTGDMPQTFPNMDWIDYLMKDAAWQEQVNVNVNGGTEKMRYFVSAGFFNQNSLFKTFSDNKDENFSFNRYNYRANLDINVSKYSQIAITLGGRVQNRTTMGGGEGQLFRYLSCIPYSGCGIDSEGRHIIADEAVVGVYDGDALSRYYMLGSTLESTNAVNFDIQYKLDMSWLTKGLDFKVKASYNSDYTQRKARENGFGTGLQYVATLVDGKEVLRKENITWPTPYNESKWGSRNWYAETSFNYSRKFGNHNIGALALYNQSKTYYPWDSDGLYSSIPKGYIGLVGRVTYDYASKYMLDFNIGYNGSENFAPGKRFGTFPSFSAGWIPSNEKWWEPVKDYISYVKIRGSWGMVGNDNTNGKRFMYLPGAWGFYKQGDSVENPLNGTTNFGTSALNWLQGVKELSAGNPDVTWEKAQKINVGFDATFLKDRLNVNVDLFWENRKDILVSNSAMLPAVTSLQASMVNEGKVKNHGYEVSLRWTDKIGSNFLYTIAPSITYARNEVIEMLEVKPMYDYLSHTGLPVGQRFAYDLFEFYNDGTEQRYQEKYGAPMPDQHIELKHGDAVYVDINGDGQIDNYDMKPLGYTGIPELNYSLNMSFQYKGFDFSMLWIAADHVSQDLGSYFKPAFGSTGTSALTKWVAENSWTEENQNAILPRISFTHTTHNNYTSRAWVVDAKYARLKNIEIGYTFMKPKWIPLFNSVRLYATGQNVLTFADFKGNDPEAPGSGLDLGIRYPMTRVFNFGVKVNF